MFSYKLKDNTDIAFRTSNEHGNEIGMMQEQFSSCIMPTIFACTFPLLQHVNSCYE